MYKLELTRQELEEIKELIYCNIDANDYENLDEALKTALAKLQALR
jgi:hypothetical protein